MNHPAARPTRPLFAEPCPDGFCPVSACMEVIGGKWKPFILFHLHGGMKRYNELRRLIPGVTQRMLTLQLRELEADGLVSRTVHAEVPPRVEYRLTGYGETLGPILEAMAVWGSRHRKAGGGAAQAAARFADAPAISNL